MEKSGLIFASSGDPPLLVLQVPAEIAAGSGASACLAVPILSRRGGLALAVPAEALDSDKLVDELTTDGDGMLGPSKSFTADLLEEAEDGSIGPAGKTVRFLVVDFSDDVLALLSEYQADLDDGSYIPFDAEKPSGMPSFDGLAEKVRVWATQENVGRVHFYSAREEPDTPSVPKSAPGAKRGGAPRKLTNAMMAEQIAGLVAQVQAISSQQQAFQLAMEQAAPKTPTAPRAAGPTDGLNLFPKLPAVSDTIAGHPKFGTPSLAVVQHAAMMAGPPPRVRAAPKVPFVPNRLVAEEEEENPVGAPSGSDPVLMAISQQSSALTALVAHLASNSDPLGDLATSSGSGASSSTRGAQRRERLQGELAGGTSNFFLQVLQQMHRRLHPSKPVPKSEADLLEADVSMLAYLERFGGYRGCRETGLILWHLGHVVDAMTQQDFHRARELLALLICSLEQSAMDGNWNLAFIISLMEEPPIQVFQDRMAPIQMHGRPFAPLIPSQWSAIALSYIKELEVLSNKKQETVGKAKSKAQKEEEDAPSPKRRPRYPKSPKAAPAAE